MSPSVPDELLQDTNSVRRTVVFPKKTIVLIGVLSIVTITIGLLKLVPFSPLNTSSVLLPLLTPEPELTGTFVDTLSGNIVFFRENQLFEYRLPTRKMSQLIGVRTEEEVESFVQTMPAWSPDGKYLTIMDDTDHVSLIEFGTGKLHASLPLREKIDEKKQIRLTVDPSSQVLAVGVFQDDNISGQNVEFFSLETGKSVGVYPRCRAKGIWLTGTGFMTKCALGEVESVVLIQFQPGSTTMVPLAKETAVTKYTLVDEHEAQKAVALRTVSGKQDLVTISSTGSVQALAKKEYPVGTDLSLFSDVYSALAKRIEKETGLNEVRNISVATSNDWMVFEAKDGLYIALVSLSEKPYHIGAGTLPSIQPY